MPKDDGKKYVIRDLILIFGLIALLAGAGLLFAASGGASAALILPGAIAAFVGTVSVVTIGIQFNDRFFDKWAWGTCFPCLKKEGQQPKEQQLQPVQGEEIKKEEEKSKGEKDENKNIGESKEQEQEGEKSNPDLLNEINNLDINDKKKINSVQAEKSKNGINEEKGPNIAK